MRIAVVNNFYPPRVGGSAHLSDALARGYARAGHEVLVITAAYRDAPAEEERDGLRIVRLPAFMLPETRLSIAFDISFASRPSLPRRMRRLLDDFRPDAVHQHGQFFDLTWASGWYARRHQTPTLLSIHTRLENPQARYAGIFRMLDATMVKPAMRLHRPRLVVMDVLMDEYIKARYQGAYSGLEYIPVGVDPGWVGGGDGSVVRERHDLGNAPIILSVGHVIPLRDRITLVEAMPKVLAEAPTARLLVVGRVYYDQFQTRARALGVDHAIVCAGPVPKTEIPHYLAAATVESHEQGFGMGTASLEAMAAGVPVVGPVRADNFPGIDLIDGSNAFLTTLGDADGMAARILTAVRDPATTASVAKAGQELVHQHFTLDRVIERHLDALAAMIH